MTHFFSQIISRKMVDIILMNVPGEFVNPKYMTRGSNSPLGVRKAALSSCPSLILTLLYPHMMSILVKIFPSAKVSIRSSIRGNGVLSLIVYLLMPR